MPHRIEEGLAKISDRLQKEIRYKNPEINPECIFPENVLGHTFKLGVVVQWVKMMVRQYDPEIIFNGELLTDLAVAHDIGEAGDGYRDVTEPQKTEEDERTERIKFKEMTAFLPHEFRQRLLGLYDVQKDASIESRMFRASELLVRMFFLIRELQAGNSRFADAFWRQHALMQPFLDEFTSLQIIFEPIQEYIDSIRAKTDP